MEQYRAPESELEKARKELSIDKKKQRFLVALFAFSLYAAGALASYLLTGGFYSVGSKNFLNVSMILTLFYAFSVGAFLSIFSPLNWFWGLAVVFFQVYGVAVSFVIVLYLYLRKIKVRT